jgi:predicted ribosome quality control (RQC) complex YloA/Tae2 family protein
MYLSKFNFENPTVPPAFAMFLRRHLLQATLKDVVQRGSERIVEFRFNTKNGTRFLICELFGKGNFILTDTKYVILNSAVIQSTKDRNIRKGENYAYPKQGFDILNLTRADFDKGLSKWKDHSIVKYLASGLGLGGRYSEEVCVRAEVDKAKKVGKFEDKDLTKVFDSVLKLITGFSSGNAVVVMEDGKAVDALPFVLSAFKDSDIKEVGSFSEAVDLLFSEGRVSEVRKQKSSAFDKRLSKVENIVESQRKSVEMLKAKQADLKSTIEVVYRNYQYISKIVERLNNAREAGHSWPDIVEAAEKERESGLVEAEMFRGINPEGKLVVLEIEDHTVELNLDKKIDNFTDELYHQVKNMNSKIYGAERTMNKYIADRTKLLAQKEELMESVEDALPKARVAVKKEWYEKFRWFFTSGGFLAVGGRDATSNEMVIKKHMEIEDWVFHTSMSGSPFFLLKGGKEKASEEDIEEVAIATASYSRAWQNGYRTQEVFYVRPEQVSKKAEAGEYLTKGSFMVRGKKTTLNPELEVCIGIVNGKVVGGPKSVIVEGEVYCLVPGKTKKSDIAKKIARKLSRNVDEVMAVLPNGTSELV